MADRPKGRVSSYAKFVSDTRAEQRCQGRNPDTSNQNFSFGYLLNESAHKWNNMNHTDRQPYYEHARQDRVRYHSEMADYYNNQK